MSYDAYMEIDTGGEWPSIVEEIGNMTSNVACMWYAALNDTDLRDLEGKTGLELIPILEAAVSHIRHPDNAAKYSAMNPSNGWGNHNGAAEFLEKILAACRLHPKAKLSLSH
jgi:hypothetical protein